MINVFHWGDRMAAFHIGTAGDPRTASLQRSPRSETLGPGESYGHVVWLRRSGACVLSEMRHERPNVFPAHEHRLAFFTLLLEGRYREHLGRATIDHEPFTVSFRPPGVDHQDEIGARGGRFFKIEVGSEWLSDLGDGWRSVPAPHDGRGGDGVWVMARLLRVARAGGVDAPLVVEEAVLDLLSWALRAAEPGERRRPSWLATVREYLHASFDQPISVRDLAAAVDVHPVYLARVFRQAYGMRLAEYVYRLRIRSACGQMHDDGTTLSHLALRYGFADQSHFTRVFKAVTGATPASFRRAVFESSRPETGATRDRSQT